MSRWSGELACFLLLHGALQNVKGWQEQEAGNPGGDTFGDSGNICRARWPRSPKSERIKHTEPREEAKAHVGWF